MNHERNESMSTMYKKLWLRQCHHAHFMEKCGEKEKEDKANGGDGGGVMRSVAAAPLGIMHHATRFTWSMLHVPITPTTIAHTLLYIDD